eukprot:8872651-Pyramimonas_sp.AAC.3
MHAIALHMYPPRPRPLANFLEIVHLPQEGDGGSPLPAAAPPPQPPPRPPSLHLPLIRPLPPAGGGGGGSAVESGDDAPALIASR